MSKKHIAIILPCYNEEENINEIYSQIYKVFEKELSQYSWSVTFVEDGSKDQTVPIIRALSVKHNNVQLVSLSRNYGHQISLLAAMALVPSESDCAITMDADLQHPPQMLPELIRFWEDGNKIVFTEKIDTEDISFVKSIASKLYYKIFEYLTEVDLPPGAADFRLYDKHVVDELLRYGEHGIFLRGIVASMGFKRVIIPYKAAKRFAGTRSYSYKRMLKLAIDGIYSYSTIPLKLAIHVGVSFSVLSLLYALYAVYSWVSGGDTPPGWASMTAGLFFTGGLTIFFIGIIGSYIGRIFIQTKNRPLYHVEEYISVENRK
jgi:glycosyltransferase involved in cell wall biosynthesis